MGPPALGTVGPGLLTASLLSPLRQTALFIRQINDSDVKMVQPPRVDHELQPLVDKVFLQSQTIADNMRSLEQQRNIMRLIMEPPGTPSRCALGQAAAYGQCL